MKTYCVHFLTTDEIDFVKVGYCPTDDLDTRIRDMQKYHAGNVEAIQTITDLNKNDAKRLIKAVLNKFGRVRRAGQLIKLRPRFKGFLLNPDGIDAYKEHHIRDIETVIENWKDEYTIELTF